MNNQILVGLQYGDEGKGKITDILAEDAYAVVRFQGGANAGHTLVVDGQQVILHLLPSSVLRERVLTVLGPGMVVDPLELLEELQALKKIGYSPDNQLVIDPRAHLVLPCHKELDRVANCALGTTGKGIGPAYQDKAARTGIRFADLANGHQLYYKLTSLLREKNVLLQYHGGKLFGAYEIWELLLEMQKVFQNHIQDSVSVLDPHIHTDSKIVFEGAQGTWLDIHHGDYPYVTSSNTLAGAACTGGTIAPTDIDSVIGVAKAYTTRVGTGVLRTQANEQDAKWLREQGNEYGATTGRPRDCGWFNAKATRQACLLNGVTEVALTKLDVLTGLEKIPVKIGQDRWTEYKGWTEDISSCRKFEDLPHACQTYINSIQSVLNVDITIISVGPQRNQTIFRPR